MHCARERGTVAKREREWAMHCGRESESELAVPTIQPEEINNTSRIYHMQIIIILHVLDNTHYFYWT